MRKTLYQKTKWISIAGSALLLSGCAPGPPPPVFPGLFGFGLVWLVIGLLVWIGVALWKKHGAAEPPKTDYLTEALNAINKRLTVLEEKIEQLGNQQGRDKK